MTGDFALTPFVRGSALWETQDAYTDCAAVAQPKVKLNRGSIAPGLKIAQSMTFDSGVIFTPSLTAEANYAFGNSILAGFNKKEQHFRPHHSRSCLANAARHQRRGQCQLRRHRQ